MDYTSESCITLPQLKKLVVDGAYGKLVSIKDSKLYKNQHNKWRLSFTVQDVDGFETKKINILATIEKGVTNVNKKSFEFSKESDKQPTEQELNAKCSKSCCKMYNN